MAQYAVDPMSVATDPRFSEDGEAFFTELAERYGRDEAGLVWTAACFAADQRAARRHYHLIDGREYVKVAKNGSAVWFISKRTGDVFMAKSWNQRGHQMHSAEAAEVLDMLELVRTS